MLCELRPKRLLCLVAKDRGVSGISKRQEREPQPDCREDSLPFPLALIKGGKQSDFEVWASGHRSTRGRDRVLIQQLADPTKSAGHGGLEDPLCLALGFVGSIPHGTQPADRRRESRRRAMAAALIVRTPLTMGSLSSG